MNATVAPWFERIVRDLRDCSNELLDVGLAPSSLVAKSAHHSSSLRATIHAVDTYCRQLPQLLNELERDEIGLIGNVVSTSIPRGIVRSHRPCDYALRDGRAIPRRWLRGENETSPRVDALRWLIWLGEILRDDLKVHSARSSKQIEDALVTRDGESNFAEQEREVLGQMRLQSVGAEQRLRYAMALVRNAHPRPLAPTKAIPCPFPKTPAWGRFRRQAHLILNPNEHLGSWVGELLSDPIPIADYPYLYQRWCGLRIIQSAAELGWAVESDFVGALFLGGMVELRRSETRVWLWIDPRLSNANAEKIGWVSAHRGEELTPDFLFVFGEAGARDAYVLDATLSTDRELLERKGRYLHRLTGVDSRIIAGVSILRKPLRSWAIAPIETSSCRLGDAVGATGVIPLSARASSFSGLSCWLQDLFALAEAKQRQHEITQTSCTS